VHLVSFPQPVADFELCLDFAIVRCATNNSFYKYWFSSQAMEDFTGDDNV